MNTELNALQHQGYRLTYSLHHRELVPFVSEYLFRKNYFTLGYLFLNIILFLLFLWKFIALTVSSEGTFGDAITYFGYGCAITFLLIMPHELLHGLAYKISGAGKVSYKANWRKLYFMAVADMFITSRKPFYFIALLPITAITMLLLVAAAVSDLQWQLMWLTTAFVHASMCAGDFGLLSYFAENNQLEIVTYDDVENETSYFYSKEK